MPIKKVDSYCYSYTMHSLAYGLSGFEKFIYHCWRQRSISYQHLQNRHRLVVEGKVVIPEELLGASIAPVKNPAPLEANDEPIVKTATPKPAAKKKTKAKKKK